MAQLSPIFSRGLAASATVNSWYPLCSNYNNSAVTAAEINASQPISTDGSGGTLNNFSVTVTTAPGAGTSYAFTLIKNGVDTAITANIADTATASNDLTHSVSYV